MSGDVDEAGWEYARNFGRLRMFPHLRRNTPLPRANAQGALEMNRRIADENKKRNAKEEEREDHGIEALKRSAKSRSAKWSGQGDPGTFVRRRRWIRLRRRKALAVPSTANTPRVGTPGSLASGDWTKAFANRAGGAQPQHAKLLSDDMQSSTSEDDSEDLSDLEEDEVDSEGHEIGQTASDFFPRRTPGNLANHSDDPLRARRSKAQERRQRHAREFTGTVRELKSLLPSIMQTTKPARPHHAHSNSTGASPLLGDRARLWRDEIDARNPFLSWKFVKKRLEDDDLAFATAALRARDRKHAQRMKEREERAQARAATRRMPSSFAAPPTAEAPAPEMAAAGFSPPPRPADLSAYDPPAPPSRSATHELTRDALVEINFRRVLRVLRACKIDRQRLHLWRTWLGAEAPDAAGARAEDLADLGLALSPSVKEEGAIKSREQLASEARARWNKGASLPDPLDVWDVLERRLDAILLLFEFQGSRASLIRLLLTLHASSHPEHRFRRTSWSLPVGMDGQHVQPNAPSSLDPATSGKTPTGAHLSHGVPRVDQRETGVPRLEFWSDLSRVAASILQAPPPGVAAHDAQSLRDEAELLRSPSRGVAGLDSPHFGPSRPRSPFAPVPLSRPPSRASTPQQSASAAAARRGSASVRSASPAQGGAGPRRTAPGRSSLHLQQQGEADRAFLKELLQLPESRRGELLLSSQASAGATASSSSIQSQRSTASRQD
ncbi:hypothetical protein FA09DRAFT_198811 [Tilletiopsis washingtonensis]|uniref:Uncharacterized protein n=1 Tax=Tilletiopsis washingtonensis TaxID=58919 RepID=A0A316ZI26_9BASI|nr:hypothetical protein FA09DRAFT_198811 [Tilletiopsis washingtonensis]PWN99923.1 hypothetical protein FA09DRAFT_198811 [Tilletiopsis washingtonensis]